MISIHTWNAFYVPGIVSEITWAVLHGAKIITGTADKTENNLSIEMYNHVPPETKLMKLYNCGVLTIIST